MTVSYLDFPWEVRQQILNDLLGIYGISLVVTFAPDGEIAGYLGPHGSGLRKAFDSLNRTCRTLRSETKAFLDSQKSVEIVARPEAEDPAASNNTPRPHSVHRPYRYESIARCQLGLPGPTFRPKTVYMSCDMLHNPHTAPASWKPVIEKFIPLRENWFDETEVLVISCPPGILSKANGHVLGTEHFFESKLETCLAQLKAIHREMPNLRYVDLTFRSITLGRLFGFGKGPEAKETAEIIARTLNELANGRGWKGSTWKGSVASVYDDPDDKRGVSGVRVMFSSSRR